MRCVFVIALMLLSQSIKALPQSLGIQGQLSGWMTIDGEKVDNSQMGLRYIPDLSVEKIFSKAYTLRAELSVNAYGSGQFAGWDDISTTNKIKPYRMWLRFAFSQFEARIGLQKINFGSASLLRPLMWFNRIDPRDPLHLTDGVYGLLMRYYFLNNVNIWVWGLMGNDETKGWEFFPSDRKKLEYGGRMQVPFLSGEMAFTFHNRKIDLDKINPSQILMYKGRGRENRFGFDGKWDIGIGLWFEGTLVHQDYAFQPLPYRRFMNIGFDYTFGFGNGLYMLGEYFRLETSEKPFSAGEHFTFSAVNLNYPIGLIDNLSGIIYYNRENHNWYRFIDWQRTYDRWGIHFMFFWNPEKFQIYQNIKENNLFAGKGIQLMAVFNH